MQEIPKYPGHRYDGCDDCRAYQRARVAANRAARRESGNLNHGSRSAYDAGCRDRCCRKVRSAIYYRDLGQTA